MMIMPVREGHLMEQLEVQYHASVETEDTSL